jgi:integrase
MIKWQVPDLDGGMRHRYRRGFTTRKAAATELRKRLGEVDKGGYVEPAKLTVAEYLEGEFLPSLRLKPSTESSYRKNVRLHLVPHIGKIPLAQLTGQRLTVLYRHLEASGRADGEGGLSARTVRYIHTIVKSALGEAVQNGLLVSNPADRAKPPSAQQAKSPELRYWTPEQSARFLRWAQETEEGDFPAWQLLLATGMRRGEVLALRWGDLDLIRATVAVRRTAGLIKDFGGGERIEVGTPKGYRARVIDVDPGTVAALKAQRSLLAELDLRLARDVGLVFPGRDGGVRHPERFSRSFGWALKRCWKAIDVHELPRIRLHDLRHSHATALLTAGVHPKVVQERLGHATISITLDTYSHVIPALGRDAAATWAESLWGPS